MVSSNKYGYLAPKAHTIFALAPLAGRGEAAPGQARARGDVPPQPATGVPVRGVHGEVLHPIGASGGQLHGHDEHSHAAEKGG